RTIHRPAIFRVLRAADGVKSKKSDKSDASDSRAAAGSGKPEPIFGKLSLGCCEVAGLIAAVYGGVRRRRTCAVANREPCSPCRSCRRGIRARATTASQRD